MIQFLFMDRYTFSSPQAVCLIIIDIVVQFLFRSIFDVLNVTSSDLTLI